MLDFGKKNVLGILVDAVDIEAAENKIMEAARISKPLSVSATAVHGVMTGVLDSTHRYRLNHLDLVLPDGQPVRWALNWLYRLQLAERVYGPELMMRLCSQLARENLAVFLFGSTESVLTDLRRNLIEQLPSLRIAGVQPSRFCRVATEYNSRLINKINDSGAAVTFVGLGCPRQEVWIYENRHALTMPAIAVGAAFDIHAGRVPQAPNYMQKCGLEWLFRFIREPCRLWPRYLLLGPLYLESLLMQLLRLYRFTPENQQRPDEKLLFG